MIANSEKFLRDLNWLTSCPSLLESPMILGTENWQWKVDELDLLPIQSFMKTSASYRVGYYVESLVGVCLQKLNGIGDIQHALQIKGSERTLGEIDFLYRLNDILHHLEISLKFYLYESEDNHSGSHFVGPNSSDYFEKKRDKMLQKQIPLGREHFPEIEVSQIMMKGMIFYPPDVDTASCLPKGLNPDHRRGVWIRASDCDWLSSSNGMEFGMILKKP